MCLDGDGDLFYKSLNIDDHDYYYYDDNNSHFIQRSEKQKANHTRVTLDKCIRYISDYIYVGK
jgi:hypothetical protein